MPKATSKRTSTDRVVIVDKKAREIQRPNESFPEAWWRAYELLYPTHSGKPAEQAILLEEAEA